VTERKVRMGYVGAGFIAQQVHIPNIVALGECELTALAEVRPKLGAAAQERWRIPRLHPDHRALAEDPDVDAVAVSGHFAVQGEIAADLLRAGKPVFMEKPMALSVRQAERILEAEQQGGGRLMVGYMKRYDAGNVRARAAIDEFTASGGLGRVTYARNHGFCGVDWTAGMDHDVVGTDEPMPAAPPLEEFVPAWLPAGEQGFYLGYLQQYTHNVNLLRYLLDAGDDVSVEYVDLDRDLRGIAAFRMGGVRAVIESGQVAHHGWEEHTQVYFERGWVKVTSPPLLMKNMPAQVEVYRHGDGRSASTCELFPAEGWTWSYREEMRHFVNAVRTGEPFRSGGRDTLTDVRVFEDVFRMLCA
jgi:predicted dehydrogenase